VCIFVIYINSTTTTTNIIILIKMIIIITITTTITITIVIIIVYSNNHNNLPYMLGSIWSPGPCLAFEDSKDPVDTSAQAALAPHQTSEQEESADTIFMVL
jgi:hypothetical protein